MEPEDEPVHGPNTSVMHPTGARPQEHVPQLTLPPVHATMRADLLRRKASDHGLRGDVERREDLDAKDEQLRAGAGRSATLAIQPS